MSGQFVQLFITLSVMEFILTGSSQIDGSKVPLLERG
jgi:hypothetical protein